MEKDTKTQRVVASALGLILGTVAVASVAWHWNDVSSEGDFAAQYNAGVELQTQVTGQLAETVKRLEAQVAANTKAIGVSTGDGGAASTAIKEVKELEKAVAALEKRVTSTEKTGSHLKSVSEVRITGPASPTQNRLVPSKVIEYRGRTSYTLVFTIRSAAVRPYWSNIFHIGDTNGIRSPGIWQYPHNRRAIHFRQSGEKYPHVNWNWGCDPSDSVTPATGHWFKVEVKATKHDYRVNYNGALRCRAVFDVMPPAGQQHAWFSDPWYHAAPVSIKGLYFKVY